MYRSKSGLSGEVFHWYYEQYLMIMKLEHPSFMSARTSLVILQASQYRIKHGIHVNDFLDNAAPQIKIPALKALYEAYRNKTKSADEILARLQEFIEDYIDYLIFAFDFPENLLRETGAGEYVDQNPEELRKKYRKH